MWEEGVGGKGGALLSKSEDEGGTSIHSSRWSVLGRAASCRGEAEGEYKTDDTHACTAQHRKNTRRETRRGMTVKNTTENAPRSPDASAPPSA
jgi:hypothetical protein